MKLSKSIKLIIAVATLSFAISSCTVDVNKTKFEDPNKGSTHVYGEGADEE